MTVIEILIQNFKSHRKDIFKVCLFFKKEFRWGKRWVVEEYRFQGKDGQEYKEDALAPEEIVL